MVRTAVSAVWSLWMVFVFFLLVAADLFHRVPAQWRQVARGHHEPPRLCAVEDAVCVCDGRKS